MNVAQEQLLETLRRRFHAIIAGEDAEFNARAGLLAVDDLERLLNEQPAGGYEWDSIIHEAEKRDYKGTIAAVEQARGRL